MLFFIYAIIGMQVTSLISFLPNCTSKMTNQQQKISKTISGVEPIENLVIEFIEKFFIENLESIL
jgi:predicted PurR-regulated permease PerM